MYLSQTQERTFMQIIAAANQKIEHAFTWLLRRAGLQLPKDEKECIESLYKWITYNGVAALLTKAAEAMQAERLVWWATMPLVVTWILVIVTAWHYGARYVIEPLLVDSSRRVSLGIGLGAMTCLQFTFVGALNTVPH